MQHESTQKKNHTEKNIEIENVCVESPQKMLLILIFTTRNSFCLVEDFYYIVLLWFKHQGNSGTCSLCVSPMCYQSVTVCVSPNYSHRQLASATDE